MKRAKPRLQTKACLQDIVPHSSGRRFCNLCQCMLPDSSGIIAKHVVGKRHQKTLQA